jgi:hypothetical protein
MSDDNTGNFQLSTGAIKFLESQTVTQGTKKSMDVDFTFQIERATKNSGGIYNCSLLDSDSKYAGFLLTYEQKDGIPGVGDIIHVGKILIAILPSRDSHIYYCKNVRLIRRAMALQVDPKQLSNVSKKKSMENYRNTVYRPSDNENAMQNNNPNNGEFFDDSGCTLISSLTTFSSNARLYLKCKVKNPIKNFVAKSTKKDCTLQSYIFIDTKGDEIQATAFNKAVENFSKIIQEGGIYEIRKCNIQLAERAYNATKCDYKLGFNESTQVIPAPDNGKFSGVKFSIIPLEQIVDFPIGKIIDVFGFVLDDKGFQEITTKNEKILKMQKLLIGDDTLSRIELTLWEPFGSPDNNYSLGDLIAVKNCRVKEFNGRKQLSTTDSTEVKKSLDPESDSRLRKFYDEHQNENDYKDVQGEMISSGVIKSPAELVFIKDIQNTYEIEMDNKDRPVFEINATVTRLNHSERNYYTGCAKCHKKMETDVCTYCSCTEKKVMFTLSLDVRDATSHFWIDMFGELAEKFLGIKGEDYENLIRNGTTVEENEGLIPINERVEYHTFSFIGKVRENIFNDTKRYRFNVFRFNEITVEKRKSLARMLSNLLK